ncbi:MAG: glycosyltransferase family 4 protein [Coriobacteriia bacterium]
MRVLYLTNIPAPYRVEFFNQLAERVDLTVAYEERRDGRRDDAWLAREGVRHEAVFLDDLAGPGDLARVRAARRLVADGGFDLVVVGCYNSRVGALVTLWLKCSPQRYAMNVDGMYFPGTDAKRRFRDWLVGGADGYLIAGGRTGEALRPVAKGAPVYPYRFSSLTREQLQGNAALAASAEGREGFVLCVGQYLPYKGIDDLLDVARAMPEREFVFVGSGRRAFELREAVRRGGSNVTVVDFLGADVLGVLYRRCAVLVLPSRQECWGLVVHEALSCGAPVVSTWGAGAAVELLSGPAPERLAAPGDAGSLAGVLSAVLAQAPVERAATGAELQVIAAEYSIESMVEDHVAAFEAVLAGVPAKGRREQKGRGGDAS